MDINAQQRHKLKKFVKELRDYRANHTELVTVYIPAGYELSKIVNHLNEEQGTATNIKSTSTRKNVVAALEKMIQHLKLYKRTPPNGLVVFSGNVASREGQQDVRVWSLEPPIPVSMRTYRCDKTFMLDLLEDMIEDKTLYGLVVIDRRDANIAFLKGKLIVPLMKTHSPVPGKFKAGGQCLKHDSVVQLSDGSLPHIKNLHNPHVVKSVMVTKNFEMEDSNVTDKWDTTKSKVYKIVTKFPRFEVESSKDHVFFVATHEGLKEKAASELRVDDYLLMPEVVNIEGMKQKLNSSQCYNSFTINDEGRGLIVKKREEKGLLQRELAEKIDVTQTTISSFEIGKLNADKNTLQKLCTVLCVDFQNFIHQHTVPYTSKAVSLPTVLDEEFAQFLGYLVGDGCVETDRVTFFEQDEQVARAYQEKYEQYFEMESSYRFREQKNYHQLRFGSRPLVRLIRHEFPEIKKSNDTLIPEKILKSSDDVVAGFLRGLFDAEGYTSTRGNVSLGINNKRLAQQIQMALLRFSIISSLYEYDNRANHYSDNSRFTVDITEGMSLQLFKKHIEFTSEKKASKLQQAVQKKTNRSNVRQIVVPGTKVRQLIEDAGYNLALFPKVNNFFRNERMMGKEVFMDSIISQVKDVGLRKKLLEVYNYPILPVKIASIAVREDDVEMSDISVKNQNFIANGLLVHNSAQRFHRLIEGAAKDHYRKVAEHMKEQFLGKKLLKGIIIGGPGPTKHDFLELGQLTNELKMKVIAVKDLSYTGDFGLQELVDKSQDVLAQEEIAVEKKVMTQFFTQLAKSTKKVSYGKEEVERALQMGAVDTLLLSENIDDNVIEELTEEAEKVKTKVMIISTATREGAQLKEMGGVVALLRFAIES